MNRPKTRNTSTKKKKSLQRPSRVNLASLFEDVAKEMKAKFETIRSNIKHAPTKGGTGENEWIYWLREYLPKRYQVGQGFVTDSTGLQSLQQDIVIYDRQYSPVLYSNDNVRFIPSESVYAVIEVKTSLTKPEIQDAAKKIGSVRSLYRAPGQIVRHAGGKYDAKQHGRIFGYIVAPTSAWIQNGAWSSLRVCLPADNKSFIDGGCILDSGAFSARKHRRKVQLTSSAPREALLGFFGLLFEDLKELATVSPWDLGHYASVVQNLRALR